jgi:hypothetical protein
MSSAECRTPAFGPLKLTIGDQVILLDNAADGETHPCTGGGLGRYVRLATERTNRAFVEKSGKWTAFGIQPWAPLRHSSVTPSAAMSQLLPQGPAKLPGSSCD